MIRWRIASVTFMPKEGMPPLQMADVLAYEAAKHLPRRLGKEARPTRTSLANLLASDTPEHIHEYFGAESLRHVLSTWPKIVAAKGSGSQ